MLVGLLLPAVNMAREAGRRTICENNLHQLSMACLSHAQKLGFFPSGGWGSNWVGDSRPRHGPQSAGRLDLSDSPLYGSGALHDLGKGPDDSGPGNLATTARRVPRGSPRPSGSVLPVAPPVQAYPIAGIRRPTAQYQRKLRWPAAPTMRSTADRLYIPHGGGPRQACRVAAANFWTNLRSRLAISTASPAFTAKSPRP